MKQVSKADQLDYIQAILLQLREMAAESQMRALVYFIEMAIVECADVRNVNRSR